MDDLDLDLDLDLNLNLLHGEQLNFIDKNQGDQANELLLPIVRMLSKMCVS